MLRAHRVANPQRGQGEEKGVSLGEYSLPEPLVADPGLVRSASRVVASRLGPPHQWGSVVLVRSESLRMDATHSAAAQRHKAPPVSQVR